MTRKIITLLAIVAFGAVITGSANAAIITMDDSATYAMPRTWTAGGWTITQGDIGVFDPSNSDKLVVTLGYRASGGPAFSGVTYNGVAMTEAVQHATADERQVTGIFYLDNPGAAGDLVISTDGAGFGFATSLHAVSGTLPGVGNTSSAEDWTTSLIAGSGSLVVAQNTVFGTDIPEAQSPLGQLLSETIADGTHPNSHGSGYAIGAEAFDPTFSQVGSAPSITSAEFAAIPEPTTALLAALGLLGVLFRRPRRK